MKYFPYRRSPDGQGHFYFNDKIAALPPDRSNTTMTSPFTKSAAVPDIIWSSMKDVFDASISQLVKDIAKTLDKDPAPLLQAVKANKNPIYIFDESAPSEIDMRCSFLCQRPSAPLFCQPCGRPILWSSGLSPGTERCAEHAYASKMTYSLPTLYPLDTEEKYFANDDGTVFTTEYEAVGTYNRDTGRLTLFAVE
jgi:hypothetical protein